MFLQDSPLGIASGKIPNMRAELAGNSRVVLVQFEVPKTTEQKDSRLICIILISISRKIFPKTCRKVL